MEDYYVDLLSFLERNSGLFEGRRVAVVGDLLSAQVVQPFANAAEAVFLFDNITVYDQVVASMGEAREVRPRQFYLTHSAKNVTAVFSSAMDFSARYAGYGFDMLLVVLTKSKPQCQRLLHVLSLCLAGGAQVLIAGHNSAGGKSAASLLTCTPKSHVTKPDSARKCTLFAASYERPFAPFEDTAAPFGIGGQDMYLWQVPGVFSYQRPDPGTLLLLEGASDILLDLSRDSTVLDLGCGSGIIAVYMALLGFGRVTASDISAEALSVTSKNASQSNVWHSITTIAANMLEGLGSYDLILTNPPFHEGLAKNTAAVAAMFDSFDSHLNAGGRLILVENNFLQYEKTLAQQGRDVQVLDKNSKYTVIMAGKG